MLNLAQARERPGAGPWEQPRAPSGLSYMSSESSPAQWCQGPCHSVSLKKCQRQTAHKAPRQTPPGCKCSLASQEVPFLPAATHGFLPGANALHLVQSTPATPTSLPQKRRLTGDPISCSTSTTWLYCPELGPQGLAGVLQHCPSQYFCQSSLLAQAVMWGWLASAQEPFPAGADPRCTPCLTMTAAELGKLYSHIYSLQTPRNKVFMASIIIRRVCCWIKTRGLFNSSFTPIGIDQTSSCPSMGRMYLPRWEGQASCLCQSQDSSTLSPKSFLALTLTCSSLPNHQ